MATLKDVAKMAEVSVATVSRYLNNSDYVSVDTGRRIDAACEKLGYSTGTTKARVKNQAKMDVIGVIISDFKNVFFADAVVEIERIAKQHGKNIIICDSQNDPAIEIQNINILKSIVGGLLIAPVSEVVVYNREFLVELNNNKFPVVLMDRDLSNTHLDGVFVDGFECSYRGVSNFIELGHKEIAFLSGPTTCKPGMERLNGYLEALKNNGIPVKEEYILYGDFDYEKGYNLAKNLFEKHKNITAVFAANVYMGLGILKALDELDLKIPDDVSFLTFDDYLTFDFKRNRYSIIDNPGTGVGREAIELLLDRMKNFKKKRIRSVKRVILSAELVLRGSEKKLQE